MKLGGLTWWRNNYGSVLQAYALQTLLNGYDGIEYEIICQYGKKIASIDNFTDKLRRIGIRKTLIRVFWKYALPGLRKRSLRIQQFVDKELKISTRQYREETISEANSEYDGFVCGSDQIWNLELVAPDAMYWLGFAEKGKKKIAYAPSVGVTGFSEQQKEQIRQNLSSFDAVSVREESSAALINEIMGKNCCKTMPDPTIAADRELWDGFSEKPLFSESYVFAYMLRGTKQERKRIESFAKSKGLKLVTIPFLDYEHTVPYDIAFGDQKLWDADPTDFIRAIRHAEYVFTDSFHATVFCCLYHVPFFTFPKIGKAQNTRLTALQEQLKTGKRMITADTATEILDRMPDIDWKRSDRILEEQRAESRRYLDLALK